MKAVIEHGGKSYSADFSQPIDISIPLRNGKENPKAFYAPDPSFEPVHMGDWVGSLDAGSPVNFTNVSFNPHGNGTHTECIGHIKKGDFTINQLKKSFFHFAQLITVNPQKEGEDFIIYVDGIREILATPAPKALIIRTIPNSREKLTKNHTGTNPAYLSAEAAQFIHDSGIEHLLIDLPSVDREEDEGKLSAHKAFWNYPKSTRHHCTITELIFVDDEIEDGLYLLNLQIAPFELDASPSKPVLYRVDDA